MEQVGDVGDVAVQQGDRNGIAVLVENSVAILIDLNKIIANAQVKLRFRSHGLTAAAYKLDRIARDNVLQRKQNKRYAKEHRDELQHSLEDVLSHRYDLSPVVGLNVKMETVGVPSIRNGCRREHRHPVFANS